MFPKCSWAWVLMKTSLASGLLLWKRAITFGSCWEPLSPGLSYFLCDGDWNLADSYTSLLNSGLQAASTPTSGLPHWPQELFNFMYSVVSLWYYFWPIGVFFVKSLSMFWNVFSVFCSSNFRVLGLTLRSLIHFEVIVWTGYNGYSFILLHVNICQLSVEEAAIRGFSVYHKILGADKHLKQGTSKQRSVTFPYTTNEHAEKDERSHSSTSSMTFPGKT